VRKDLTTVRDELQELSTGTGKYEMSPSQHHMHHASFERRVIRGGGDHQVHEVNSTLNIFVLYMCSSAYASLILLSQGSTSMPLHRATQSIATRFFKS
jgi:hypothetical protein